MTQKAGQRLFEAIGRLPDEIILEAEQDGLLENAPAAEAPESLLENADGGMQLDGQQENAADPAAPQDSLLKNTGDNTQLGWLLKNTDSTAVLNSQRENTFSNAEPDSQLENKSGDVPQEIRLRKTDGDAGLRSQPETAAGDAAQGSQQKNADSISRLNSQQKNTDSISGLGRRRENMTWQEKLGGYLKYLPVAACLCIVLGSAFHIIFYYITADHAAEYSMSDLSGMDSGNGSGFGQESAGTLESQTEENNHPSDQKSSAAADSPMDKPAPKKPQRYDAYEGPVLAMTATGDTQKLKTNRSITGTVSTENRGGVIQPLFHVEDIYQIKNTSQEEKTLQLVYPFVSTLNLAFDLDGSLIEISGQENKSGQNNESGRKSASGQENTAVTYSIGEGVSSYWNQNPEETVSAEEYQKLFDREAEYQEHALEKAADWNREVRVYTFSEISVQDDAGWNDPGVISVTITGTDADVLTYGFDYTSQREDGVMDYCFFISEENPQLFLIVTGEMEQMPQLGYYSNLDCREEIDGVQCTMHEQAMSYADALRLCSRAQAKQLAQDYEQDVYTGSLPEFMNGEMAYQALTVISEEEKFYDTLVQQYQSTELKEIYEKLFGETRIVYALAAVTIPAGQTVQVTARTQKRQAGDYYALPGSHAPGQDYEYEFLSCAYSHLNIQKTTCRIALSEEWQITGHNMGLSKKKSGWRAVLNDDFYHFSIAECLESETFINND